MNKIILAAVFLFALPFITLASGPTDPSKTTTIKGIVTDDKGQPITGAVVVIEGTDKKVYTDFDGNFEITATESKNLTIKVSSVAYKDEKIVLKNEQLSTRPTKIKLRKKSKFVR